MFENQMGPEELHKDKHFGKSVLYEPTVSQLIIKIKHIVLLSSAYSQYVFLQKSFITLRAVGSVTLKHHAGMTY